MLNPPRDIHHVQEAAAKGRLEELRAAAEKARELGAHAGLRPGAAVSQRAALVYLSLCTRTCPLTNLPAQRPVRYGSGTRTDASRQTSHHPMGNPAGMGDAAMQRMSALESASQDAAAKLSAAAANGTCLLFRAALAAAQRFPHLEQLCRDSVAAFEGRKAAVEAAVAAAAQGEPRAEAWSHSPKHPNGTGTPPSLAWAWL